MDFLKVISGICQSMDHAGIRFALIGGFAMAVRGIQRTTVDLDFIILLDDLSKAHELICGAGYHRAYQSENVSHYQSEDSTWGRIDLLHAFRKPSLSMLDRADVVKITEDLVLPVVQIEDLIGLKIQAAVNDRDRYLSDWSDIQLMITTCAQNHKPLDWNLITDYLRIFNLDTELSKMKAWYGTAN